MDQEFFTNLPPEVIINILSRLPVRTIACCKCVRKSWLKLLETHDFVKCHLSRSLPGLAVYQSGKNPRLYKIIEFEGGLDLEQHELHYSPVTKLDLPPFVVIQGSVNGLLFLSDVSLEPNGLYVCNPITRENIELCCPKKFVFTFPQVVTYGFGASKITGQHKVVRIFHDCRLDRRTQKVLRISKSDCQVYTLGTGSWRSVAPGAPLMYSLGSFGVFFSGNLHWLVSDLGGKRRISCFDLETELFSTFSSPPLMGGEGFSDSLFASEDCLCMCDNSSDDQIVIWMMKEYGVEGSWTKEFVIRKSPDVVGEYCEMVCPIKVFKDSGILMSWDGHLVFYSSKTGTTQRIDMLDLPNCVEATPHTSSFISLGSFGVENVRSC